MISFLHQIGQFVPEAFPLKKKSWPIVAPFWADVDTRKGGKLWYRDSNHGSLLKKATADVRKNFQKKRRFHAAWVLVATWDNVAYFGASGTQELQKVIEI